MIKCLTFLWLGLGYWTEQALESVHADFKSFWAMRKVGTDNSRCLDTMLNAISAYNIREDTHKKSVFLVVRPLRV